MPHQPVRAGGARGVQPAAGLGGGGAAAAIVNLLGDLWLREGGPKFEAVLAMPGVRLHLYGKREARKGRKMGHLSAVGTTPEEALARIKAARQALGA